MYISKLPWWQSTLGITSSSSINIWFDPACLFRSPYLYHKQLSIKNVYQKMTQTWMCPDLKYCPPSFLAWHSYSPSSWRWTEWIISSETLQLMSKSLFDIYILIQFELQFSPNLQYFSSFCVIWCSLHSVFNVDSIIIRLASSNKRFTRIWFWKKN